ncbi:MAG: AMP-binding protein [Candidatus Aminicenantes bacterium]|nr:AMP-binding protein [Candidatus Aminicenantes bacterium]NIM84326.1 AMP-binding protein [Candidatus Aminicenantes bacterium]NIN23812.1 AMP-binding protein [Candidatus Aminicenantes bacterium]NIN47528.1 AMP-binding protein [Candidatus Aminicenantes bacterium]NIN90448.1 AMP-binding protein [Candidatus Aminicenantes bacterium]
MANRESGTLLHILEKRAAEEPGKIAFTFHNESPCTFGYLWKEINLCANYLLQQGLKAKEPVIIAIPNSSQFFYAFYGVQRAGGIAVPVFPGSGVERIIKLADLCGAAFIVISKAFPRTGFSELKYRAKKSKQAVFFVEEGIHCQPDKNFSFPGILPGDISFIQFTSGSIGDPKGVQLTHANLITNLEQMIAGMEITQKDVFVSWLPVYHDMGLILMTMVPFYLGIDVVLLPTGLNYLKTWLKSIQERKATFTAAPDFAYRLCLIYIKDAENYHLSSLRVALNAAEPVRSSTITRFEERFKLENVMLPAYGLAEATVGVCSWKPGEKIKVDTRGYVSVGVPFPGVHMRITRDNKKPAEPGEIGEIWVKSKANTIGYFQNPKATKELFDKQGYIRTGDLGYMDEDGDYYIVGRKKNIIIQGGFNISAREVEELVDEFPFVRRSAAIGIDRGSHEGEQVYIFIEVKLRKSQLQTEEALGDITIELVQRFNNTFGFLPGRVYLLKHSAIPMTYNGKIKYLQLKELYLKGTLRTKGLILFPEY